MLGIFIFIIVFLSMKKIYPFMESFYMLCRENNKITITVVLVIYVFLKLLNYQKYYNKKTLNLSESQSFLFIHILEVGILIDFTSYLNKNKHIIVYS